MMHRVPVRLRKYQVDITVEDVMHVHTYIQIRVQRPYTIPYYTIVTHNNEVSRGVLEEPRVKSISCEMVCVSGAFRVFKG